MIHHMHVSQQAVHHSAHVHRVVSHQIAAQQFQYAARTRLAALADRVVGELSDAVISYIGLSTSTRRVLISAERQAHILKQRQFVSQIDAELAAGRLQEAIQDIQFIRWPPRSTSVYELVCEVASAQRRVLIAVKMVRRSQTRSGEDEWWIQTAHPFGQKKFCKLRAQGLLYAV